MFESMLICFLAGTQMVPVPLLCLSVKYQATAMVKSGKREKLLVLSSLISTLKVQQSALIELFTNYLSQWNLAVIVTDGYPPFTNLSGVCFFFFFLYFLFQPTAVILNFKSPSKNPNWLTSMRCPFFFEKFGQKSNYFLAKRNCQATTGDSRKLLVPGKKQSCAELL